MSRGVTSLLIALGAAAWIYNYFMKTTGSQMQRSLMAAAFSGAVIFLILYLFLGLIF